MANSYSLRKDWPDQSAGIYSSAAFYYHIKSHAFYWEKTLQTTEAKRVDDYKWSSLNTWCILISFSSYVDFSRMSSHLILVLTVRGWYFAHFLSEEPKVQRSGWASSGHSQQRLSWDSNLSGWTLFCALCFSWHEISVGGTLPSISVSRVNCFYHLPTCHRKNPKQNKKKKKKIKTPGSRRFPINHLKFGLVTYYWRFDIL